MNLSYGYSITCKQTSNCGRGSCSLFFFRVVTHKKLFLFPTMLLGILFLKTIKNSDNYMGRLNSCFVVIKGKIHYGIITWNEINCYNLKGIKFIIINNILLLILIKDQYFHM